MMAFWKSESRVDKPSRKGFNDAANLGGLDFVAPIETNVFLRVYLLSWRPIGFSGRGTCGACLELKSFRSWAQLS